MSHFVRCDRCEKEVAVLGTVTLPPGWIKVLGSDLCDDPCSGLVRDFIRFKPSDAAKLPVEPIPVAELESIGLVSDKLFETAPEVKSEEANAAPAPTATNPEAPSQGERPQGETPAQTVGTAPIDESSTEERVRTRRAKAKAKLQGQDAILPAAPAPNKRTQFPHGHNEGAQ
jgi:hypothetical protein